MSVRSDAFDESGRDATATETGGDESIWGVEDARWFAGGLAERGVDVDEPAGVVRREGVAIDPLASVTRISCGVQTTFCFARTVTSCLVSL
jgi:hypothetical protein